jgi:transcription antitermination factor NusG
LLPFAVEDHVDPLWPSFDLAPEDSHWYAIYTTARHEKRAALLLQEKRIFTFLPLLQRFHQWSDRIRKVNIPMFSCYAFVRIAPSPENRVHVLRTPGVLGFVGNERQGTPIPEEQIESLRTAMREKIPCALHPYVHAGRRVRIRGGCLNGVEGILVRQGKGDSLVISVELLQRSISVCVEGYNLELL